MNNNFCKYSKTLQIYQDHFQSFRNQTEWASHIKKSETNADSQDTWREKPCEQPSHVVAISFLKQQVIFGYIIR
jgi:hypothetical protein